MTKTKDNGETMTITTGGYDPSEKKLRKSPVPQQYDRILAGALKLNITKRALMIVELTNANKIDLAKKKTELDQQQLEFEEAQKLVG